MPLSDAARRLLRARGTAPGTMPAPPSPEPEAKPEREPDRTGYRERARREAERFRLATDSEYWVAFCFRSEDAATAFCAAARITPDGRYIPGPKLAAAVTTVAEGSRARRMLTARTTRGADPADRLAAKPPPDPLAGLPDVAAIEQDSLDELDSILAALTAPPEPSPNVLDSPHWITAYWPNRDAKDQWLTLTGLDVIGDKYVDGHQAARLLGLDLKEG